MLTPSWFSSQHDQLFLRKAEDCQRYLKLSFDTKTLYDWSILVGMPLSHHPMLFLEQAESDWFWASLLLLRWSQTSFIKFEVISSKNRLGSASKWKHYVLAWFGAWLAHTPGQTVLIGAIWPDPRCNTVDLLIRTSKNSIWIFCQLLVQLTTHFLSWSTYTRKCGSFHIHISYYQCLEN